MTNLPARQASADDKLDPFIVQFSGYGTVLWRTNAFASDSYLSFNTEISGLDSGVATTKRISFGKLSATYAKNFAVWLIHFTAIFAIMVGVLSMIGVPLLDGLEVKLLLTAISSYFTFTEFSTRSSVNPFELNKCVREEAFLKELSKEVNSTDTITVKVPFAVVEPLKKLLSKTVENKRDLVDLVGQKFRSNATDEELRDWVLNAANIINTDPNFPTAFIPVLNEHTVLLERELRAKVQADEAEARRVAENEQKATTELMQDFDEIDSNSRLTGAFTYLGMDLDEAVKAAAEKEDEFNREREAKAKASFARHRELEVKWAKDAEVKEIEKATKTQVIETVDEDSAGQFSGLTLEQIAERWGVEPDAILDWAIHSKHFNGVEIDSSQKNFPAWLTEETSENFSHRIKLDSNGLMEKSSEVSPELPDCGRITH